MSFLQGFLARFRPGNFLIDPKFAANRIRYIAQCCFVGAVMLVVLLMLDAFYQTVFIAALGASSVVAFVTPTLRASRPRCLIGGYLVGILVGCAVSTLVLAISNLVLLDERTVRIVLGAAAVGLAMFIMVTTGTEHPPGAAVALGFVLNEWDFSTIAIVLAGITSISVIKELVRDQLMDLL
ncbi:MAG: HPP family protein [Gammaproteobacteria bacterium]|nr:HPP family protein [Gammaproteobacteria bacterium]